MTEYEQMKADKERILGQQRRNAIGATLAQFLSDAIEFAREGNQTIGEKGDYYLTIEQLDHLAMAQRDLPKCPQCGEAATMQDVTGTFWDANAHRW